MDDSVVYKLKDYGFYIHEKESDQNFNNQQSNAVFYGDLVSEEDIKTICFVLSLGGLPLQTIEPSRYHDSWKARSVEIGTDTTVFNNEPFDIRDIMRLDIKQ